MQADLSQEADGTWGGDLPGGKERALQRGLRISLVIPTHNEKEGLTKILSMLPKEIDEVVVVDWQSTDGTQEVAQSMGARLINEGRRGYGRAYLTGIPLTTGDVVATLDADGTYPIENIPQMVDTLIDKPADFISCRRFPLANRGAMRRVNRLGNHMLLQLANSLFGLYLNDLLTGMWVFRRDIWQDIEPHSDDWSFSQEIKIRAACRNHIRYVEKWIPYDDRLGFSKLSPMEVGRENLQHLFKLRRTLQFD